MKRNSHQAEKNASKPASVLQAKTPQQPARKRAVIISPAFAPLVCPVLSPAVKAGIAKLQYKSRTVFQLAELYERWAGELRAYGKYLSQRN